MAEGTAAKLGSDGNGRLRVTVIDSSEALPEAGAERAIVDGAADLEQPVGAPPRPNGRTRPCWRSWGCLRTRRMPSCADHGGGRGVTSAMQRRLTALEVQRRPRGGYVVRMSDEALGNLAAKRAAIIEHRRRTGWMRAVILAPLEMTAAEWIAKYGRTST